MQVAGENEFYTSLIDSTSQLVNKIENLIDSYARLLKEDGIDLAISIKELESSPFDRARSKMKSQLINIAVCGAFSSGKSFLISALINRLEWYEREASSQDMFEDERASGYATFLPTSPEQTNSCPLSVIPSNSDKRSSFEVMFEDTKIWEDKSEPYIGEDEIYRKMLAYATDIEEWRAARAPQDRPRNVIRARLFVGAMPIPAIINDLPGIGGVGEIYLDTVHEALRQADCIVYVASAIKELTDAELTLLRFVEEISDQNRTPVFFILTQIDREPDWTKIREKNNQFLREYFTKDGRANKGFIGKGFTPISAASEAKAVGRFKKGEISEANRTRAIEKSGMPSLRQVLIDHLTTHSGPTHLREIVVQMHAILKGTQNHLLNRIEVETIPLEDAHQRVHESTELIKNLMTRNRLLMDEMERIGQQTLLAAFARTDANDLLAALKKEVEPLINKADLTKDSERDKIQQAMRKVRDEWLQRPKVGFISSWTQAWNDYQKQTIILLHESLSEAVRDASITFPVIVRDDAGPNLGDSGLSMKDTLELMKVAWPVSIGAVGLGAGGIAAGTIAVGGATIAIAPVGFFLISVGIVGMGWAWIKKQSDIKKMRKQFVEYFPKYSDQVVEQLKTQAKENINKHKGEIMNIVGQLISVQNDNVATLNSRLKTGDLKAHQVRVGLLRELEKESKSIEQEINGFYGRLVPTIEK